MSQRILFVHGLASSGRYKMADQLRILLKEAEVLSPDVPFDPDEAIPFLRNLCDGFQPDLLVGHSLGGFLTQKLRGWRKALVNAPFYCSDYLRSMKGEMQWLSPRADGAKSFLITDEICDKYKELQDHEFDSLTQEEIDRTIAFFAKDDNVVRHGDIFEQRYGKPGISYPGGHQPVFPEMKEYIVPEIKKFCGWQ